MNPNEWEDCFLLHQRPYKNTSIIAEIFTRNSGKISLIAKGAKNPKSKFFGYLVPFEKLQITYSGRSDLKTLTNIDKQHNLNNTHLSKKSYSLLYINELMIKLLPKDAANEDLFNLYSKFVEDSNATEEMDILLRNFELDLLEVLGYGINFESDIDLDQPIAPEKDYIFIAERGFQVGNKGSEFNGQDIINIKERNFKNIPSVKLKQLTQATIMYCLEGNDLKSRQIFRRLRS